MKANIITLAALLFAYFDKVTLPVALVFVAIFLVSAFETYVTNVISEAKKQNEAALELLRTGVQSLDTKQELLARQQGILLESMVTLNQSLINEKSPASTPAPGHKAAINRAAVANLL